jgi:hypothetical protein
MNCLRNIALLVFGDLVSLNCYHSLERAAHFFHVSGFTSSSAPIKTTSLLC